MNKVSIKNEYAGLLLSGGLWPGMTNTKPKKERSDFYVVHSCCNSGFVMARRFTYFLYCGRSDSHSPGDCHCGYCVSSHQRTKTRVTFRESGVNCYGCYRP